MRQFNLAIARSYTTTLLLVVLAWCCFCGGGNQAMAFHQSKVPIIIPTGILSTSSSTSSSSSSNSPLRPAVSGTNFAAVARTAVGAATLAVLLTVGTPFLAAPAFAASTGSSTAAQIYVDQIPPTTISIEINDLPIVGNLLSGTYTKIDTATAIINRSNNAPSVVIKSPKDKAKAISGAAGGHIEFDIAGKAGLKTHLDVDVAADEAGVARVRIASDLIPPLPFKNLASSSSSSKGGQASRWQVVTNMGNGESYYFNSKTGLTQFEKPDKI